MTDELKKAWDAAFANPGEAFPVGRAVVCDICDEDWTDRKESGGFLFTSKAYCPDCAVEGLMFKVRRSQCKTCIYRRSWAGTPVKELEDQVRDRYGFFAGYRICHAQPRRGQVCCRGFWNRHKWGFAAGQIAQRLGLVEFVDLPDGKP